jgi:hypothetical protein
LAKEKLAGFDLPRHENYRVSSSAVEFDLFEALPERLNEDIRTISSALGPVQSVRNLSAPEPARDIVACLELAQKMYSEERYWEMHEELESQWRKLPRGSPEKEVLQGLILLAAIYVHMQKGQEDVALSMVGRANARLGSYGGTDYHGIDVEALRSALGEMSNAGKIRFMDLPRSASRPNAA